MSLDDLERLAWDRIDGTISESDRVLLEEMMATNPDARKRFDELCRMADDLALAETAEPPTELRPRIDRALQAASPSWRRRSKISAVPARQLLYVAAGLLIGIALSQLLLPSPPVDRHHAVGAMAPPEQRPAGATVIDLDRGDGSVSLWSDGLQWTVDITLDRRTAVEIDLVADSGLLDVRSVTTTGPAPVEVSEQSNRAVLRADGPGRTVLSVTADDQHSTIHLRVQSGGRVVTQQVLKTAVEE